MALLGAKIAKNVEKFPVFLHRDFGGPIRLHQQEEAENRPIVRYKIDIPGFPGDLGLTC